jgi:hypothetical protein
MTRECPRCNDIMTLTSDFDKLGLGLSRMRLVACNEIAAIIYPGDGFLLIWRWVLN